MAENACGSAAHAMGMYLGQHHRSMLHKVVHDILTDVAANMRASSQVAQVLEAVLSVVHRASAEFSETWNARHSSDIARRLPVELTARVLHFAAFGTRVRASQVSRKWRAIAVADRRLWTTLYFWPHPGPDKLEAAVTRIRNMLERSRPCNFELGVSHRCRQDSTRRLFSALKSDLHRLEDYSGPTHVFLEDVPLPALTSFNCFNILSKADVLVVTHRLAPDRVPNLRWLTSSVINFPAGCQPYLSLQHLTCELPEDTIQYDHLFRCCPNLLTAHFIGIYNDTVLPPGPYPPSIQEITLTHGKDHGSCDFAAVLQSWPLARVSRLILNRSSDVACLIQIFLSTHDQPIKLSTCYGYHDIVLTTEPAGDFRWEFDTLSFWTAVDRVGDLRMLFSERLTSLSIVIMHLLACFEARLHAPHLVDLEINLSQAAEIYFPQEPDSDQSYYIRAPRLRRVILNVEDSFEDVTEPSRATTVLKTLDADFRSLIVYDADLLDSITVRCGRRHVESIGGYDFARFAETYTFETCRDRL